MVGGSPRSILEVDVVALGVPYALPNVGPATRVVDGLGLLRAMAGGAVPPLPADEIADLLAARLDHHETQGTATRVVRAIGRSLPIFHGGGPVGGALADHARYQANRHAKVVSWSAATPDLDHGEVCSWGQHGDVTRQVFTAVFLRGAHESGADVDALNRYAKLLDEFVASVLVIEAGDGDPVVDACVHAVLADQVGLGLAHRGLRPRSRPEPRVAGVTPGWMPRPAVIRGPVTGILLGTAAA